jgi:cytochrome c2
MVSRRACDAPLPEGVTEATTSADGCNICSNKGRYGRGTSVCGQCGRCHGCGSSNNGIGPLQATYFGLRSVVRKVDGQLRGDGDKDKDKEQQKDGKTVAGSTS